VKKVAFYTLGCKLNYSETSAISRKFEERGYRKVDFNDTPDIFIINTCSVTENADRKCQRLVREARSVSPEAYVAIIGCYAQLKPDKIASIPGVDAVLGADEKFRLPELLDGFVRKPQPVVYSCDIEQVNVFHGSFSLQDRTRSFLKVQDGCDYSCSFCTIPLARGGSRSDSVDNVVKAAREIAVTGVKEIVLTGVNTGDFGLQSGIRQERFVDLIKALDKVDELARIRISSIEPNLLTGEIIRFVTESHRVVPHFHVPLQSGSNRILRQMRRRYQRELYADRIQAIRSSMPHACIGADVIVGFPGESGDDFLETYEFLNSLDISYLHVFTYSERENTLAATMPDPVPKKIRHDRSRTLHTLSYKKRRAFYEANLGDSRDVLFEQDIDDGFIHGFSDNYVRVAVPVDRSLINKICKVQLNEISANGVVLGELVAEPVLGF